MCARGLLHRCYAFLLASLPYPRSEWKGGERGGRQTIPPATRFVWFDACVEEMSYVYGRRSQRV